MVQVEPDNLVLVQLREIRAALSRFEGRFDRLETGFNDMRLYVSHALGLGTTAELKAREIDERQSQSDERHKRTDERLASIEQRVARIEEKLVN
jgi:hypothetical protein